MRLTHRTQQATGLSPCIARDAIPVLLSSRTLPGTSYALESAMLYIHQTDYDDQALRAVSESTKAVQPYHNT